MQNGTLYEASPGRGFSAIGPWTQRELLAHELANALDDAAHINRYRAYGWRYNERLLRQVLNEALAAPVESIPQGRATLFTNLLHHHARATTQNPLGH